jgi:hypothetical protein
VNLENITYKGPAVDDEAILGDVPRSLAGMLRQINGFVQFHGGLHVRGACSAPDWHSLRAAWRGPDALHRAYNSMESSDVPFAEDCVGDQYFLRDEKVWKLSAETDEAEALNETLGAFLNRVQHDPIEQLEMQPLQQFIEHEQHGLAPGELLAAHPPFCAKQSEAGVSLSAIPALERRRFLAELAAQIRELPEGAPINFKLVD